MILHEKTSELDEPQVRQLVDLGFELLRLQKIDSEKSKLRFLYWDLHTVNSLILRQDGRAWQSAWEQSLAHRYRQGDGGANELSHAIRLSRLGDTEDAIAQYEAAIEKGVSPKNLVRSKLGTIRCLRLCGQLDIAINKIDQEINVSELSEEQRQDFDWEMLCCLALQTKDAKKIFQAVAGKNATHCRTGFVLEAFLWSFCLPLGSRKLYTLDYFSRKYGLQLKREKYLYRVVKHLLDANDEDRSFDLRLRSIGQALEMRQNLLSLDKELLLLVSALNWLTKHNCHVQRKIVENEYRVLSGRITSFVNTDCLRLVEQRSLERSA